MDHAGEHRIVRIVRMPNDGDADPRLADQTAAGVRPGCEAL
jgi:hypothetical protein